jgi:hypothetical protein
MKPETLPKGSTQVNGKNKKKCNNSTTEILMGFSYLIA